MATTPVYGLHYPGTTDSPHGPNQLQQLALDVEAKLVTVDAAVAANNAKFVAFLTNYATYAEVLTSETSANTAFVDLTTPGPAVTLVSAGTKALVMWACQEYNATPASGAAMGFAVSGATTIAASDNSVVGTNVGSTGFGFQAASFTVVTINPGSNTYTAKYRVASATTGTWVKRKIWVLAP